MSFAKSVKILGDSILKGVQLNSENNRYCINNNIDVKKISETYSLDIENLSHFGYTISSGEKLLRSRLEKGMTCDAVIMDYGGNDCDFKWQQISDDPTAIHMPNTPLDVFEISYKRIIALLKERGITPILTTLPPIDPQKYFNWFCADKLNRENILSWLGGVNTIYRYQENYSRAIEKIAKEAEVDCIDLRGAFLSCRRIDDLLCEDGIHPNTNGQKVIEGAFMAFAEKRLAHA